MSKTYYYTTPSTMQAAMNRRADRLQCPRIQAGAAGAIRPGDMWVLALSSNESHFIRVASEAGPDDNARLYLKMFVTRKPDSECYCIMRGPSKYVLDTVGVNYIRRYF